MTTAAIRQKLHKFIDTIGEKKAKAIYTLFEAEIENQPEAAYTDKFKTELEKRITYYQTGGKLVSTEMNKRLKAIRKSNA